MAIDLNDYVTVAERVVQFYAKYPEGSISSTPPEVRIIGDRAFIEVTSTVYRTPNDPSPARASAWEPFPGKTPFTRDSEMMNAETSAIGRALAALGIAVSKSLASRNEVQNRTVEREVSTPQRAKPSAKPLDPRAAALLERINALDAESRKSLKSAFGTQFGGGPAELAPDQFDAAEAFVSTFEEQVAAGAPF